MRGKCGYLARYLTGNLIWASFEVLTFTHIHPYSYCPQCHETKGSWQTHSISLNCAPPPPQKKSHDKKYSNQRTPSPSAQQCACSSPADWSCDRYMHVLTWRDGLQPEAVLAHHQVHRARHIQVLCLLQVHSEHTLWRREREREGGEKLRTLYSTL